MDAVFENMQAIILSGSARRDGNTQAVVSTLQQQSSWDLAHLLDYEIHHYDYEHSNRTDDFLPLMRRIVNDYQVLILATPVYWYAMSGRMKVFMDRITDLLKLEKTTGRQLRGMGLAVISSANSDNLGEHFWRPFAASADYLGMHYLGNVHTYEGKDHGAVITEFRQSVLDRWQTFGRVS